MVQRTSTCVVSSKAITNIALKGLYDDDGPPTEDADVWLFGTPSAVLKAIQVGVTELQGEHDKEVLSGLEKAGFKLDKGPDAAGLFLVSAISYVQLLPCYLSAHTATFCQRLS